LTGLWEGDLDCSAPSVLGWSAGDDDVLATAGGGALLPWRRARRRRRIWKK